MHRSSLQAGFSLIELLVALTVFTVVITIATGTFLVLADANAKAQNVQTVMNNLTFALDSMTREVRTGLNYYCSNPSSVPSGLLDVDGRQDCTGGGNYLSIVESGGSLTGGLVEGRPGVAPRVYYYYDEDHYGAGRGAILRRLVDGPWLPITSDTVAITDFAFVVSGTDRGTTDLEQPSVTIFVEGEAGEIEGLDTSFSIQTTVTQRLLDSFLVAP